MSSGDRCVCQALGYQSQTAGWNLRRIVALSTATAKTQSTSQKKSPSISRDKSMRLSIRLNFSAGHQGKSHWVKGEPVELLTTTPCSTATRLRYVVLYHQHCSRGLLVLLASGANSLRSSDPIQAGRVFPNPWLLTLPDVFHSPVPQWVISPKLFWGRTASWLDGVDSRTSHPNLTTRNHRRRYAVQ